VKLVNEWLTFVRRPTFFFFKDLLILETEDVWLGGGAEGESSSRLPAERRAWCSAQSLDPWDHDLNGNQESDTKPTEPPGRPEETNFHVSSAVLFVTELCLGLCLESSGFLVSFVYRPIGCNLHQLNPSHSCICIPVPRFSWPISVFSATVYLNRLLPLISLLVILVDFHKGTMTNLFSMLCLSRYCLVF